ncbi:MAG: RluA family pseudouridine synthase, partial [candidate division WOR-3 bacterium]
MQNPNTRQVLTFKVEDKKDEKRLDVFLEEKLEISRSKAKKMIESGFIYIDNVPARKPGQKLRIGQVVRATILEEKEEPPKPIEIEIPVIYNDENIAVIAKPAGIVVHPAHGHKNDTLVNALFSMFEKLSLEGGLERAGIVHRLDKETSGLMVIAKEESCHRALTEMFKERIVKKVYIAIATGNPSLREGIIEKPIGRHPIDRKKMAITEKGRYALTAFKIVKEKSPYYLVLAKPVTGRTHQIRVHLKSIGIPLLGDPIYGKT